jgi:hypothetical protein
VFDAIHVVAYFNYVNRLADGLGVELEDYWRTDSPAAFHSTSLEVDERDA